MEKRYWQDGVSLLVGIWLFFSPYVLHYSDLGGAAAWNAIVVGLGVVMASGAALANPYLLPNFTRLVVALWLVLSPWALGYNFETQISAIWNQVVAGVIIAIDAGWILMYKRYHPAHGSI